jgi:hypothetical protein
MHSGTTRRAVGALLGAVALVLVTVGSGSAHEPVAHLSLQPSHFNGDGNFFGHGTDTSGENNEAQVAGDALNQRYLFRGIAAPEARYFEWYLCTSTGQNVFRGDCGPPAARDDSPTFSAPPGGAAQVAAFTAPFDINLDGPRVVQAVACIDGPPARFQHCRNFRIDPVHFDDSATADHPATDSGEIIQPAHGGAVQNAGFTAVAHTSQSDIGRVFFCLDIGTNAATEENVQPRNGCDPGSAADNTPDDSSLCGSVPPGVDCWEVTIDPPDESEFSLGIVEQDDPTGLVQSGQGDCEGDTAFILDPEGDLGDDCQLDKIYVTSLANPPTQGPQGPTCPGFRNDKRNQIIGTSGSDELIGSPNADVICGLGGNDVMRGVKGNDALVGGPGNDKGAGGPGKDRAIGGPGKDRLAGGAKGDVLKGGPKNDRLNGGAGIDACNGGPGRDREISCES